MKRRTFLSRLGLVSLFGGLAGAVGFRSWDPANFYYRGPPTDHFDGIRFHNPGGEPPRQLADLVKWKMSETAAQWPDEFPSPHDGARPASNVGGAELVITMISHATLLIQTDGLNVLTDPVFSERASPTQLAGPKRVNPPGVRFDHLPPIDLVLLSHNHYDHLDLATMERLHATHDPLFVCPLGNDTLIRDAAPQARCIAADWGDSVDVGGATKVHLEPCHHWSARGVKDRRMALWAAFVIETGAGKILFVGDTGFDEGTPYRQLAKRHDKLRAAILPIGAYEPRWFMKAQHQDPDEAVQGHLLCGAETSIAHHWGTFQLTNEAIDDPANRLVEARNRHGLDEADFVLLRPGESWQG